MASQLPPIFITGIDPSARQLNRLVANHNALAGRIEDLEQTQPASRLGQRIQIRKVATVIAIGAITRLIHVAFNSLGID